MAEILVGTASWTDKTLIDSGRFYPPEVKTPEARLQYYASQFPLVEVDSSYYALPSVRNAQLWVERTPDRFTFNLKAFRLFTQHPAARPALPRDIAESLPPPDPKARSQNVYLKHLPEELSSELWRRFGEALRLLHDAGKLGVVVCQFPPWFYPSDESRDHILMCQRKLPDYCLAIEFRHSSWLSERNLERTLDFLETNKLAYVAVDEPQGFRSSVPPVAVATADIALVRFHGRNRETWEAKGLKSASERFNYLYREAELREWVPRVEEMARVADRVHLVMNTNYEDQGVVNARMLAQLLGGEAGKAAG